MTSNLSIERTSFGKLRLPAAAAHVKRVMPRPRWDPGGCSTACNIYYRMYNEIHELHVEGLQAHYQP